MARTVRCTNISRGDSAKPDARIAEANWIDMIESPPSAKNDSVTDTRSTCNSPAITEASSSSTAPSGATYAEAAPKSGAGNAFRSTLPELFSGISASSFHTVGTMNAASFSDATVLTASISSDEPDT